MIGAVRAVELAHVFVARNGNGEWLCGICKLPVTLHDLLFDHVLALADGGEQRGRQSGAAHRKCNEMKVASRASRQRAGSWFDEWADNSRSRTAS